MDNYSAYTDEERRCLLDIARHTIAAGLARRARPTLALTEYSAKLTRPGASFVTLKKSGTLRGCIGSLAWQRPLAEDINHNAFSAAFHDPRFSPLTPDEYPTIKVSLSILSATTPIQFLDESSLLAQLRPGIDGLVIGSGSCRATFLPSVWDSLQEPEEFFTRLKQKAGFGHRDTVEHAERYTVEEFGE